MSELTIEELTFLLEKRPNPERKLALLRMLKKSLEKREEKLLVEIKEISLRMVDDGTPEILHEEIWNLLMLPFLREMGKRDDLFCLMSDLLGTGRRIHTTAADIEHTGKYFPTEQQIPSEKTTDGL